MVSVMRITRYNNDMNSIRKKAHSNSVEQEQAVLDSIHIHKEYAFSPLHTFAFT